MAEQLTDVTAIASGERTSTTYGPEFYWNDAKGMLTVAISAYSGTPTITPGLEAYDPTSGGWFSIFTAAAAYNVVGVARLVYILTDTAFLPTGFTESKQVYLAPVMRLKMLHSGSPGTDPASYSVAMLRVNSNNLGI